MPIKVLFLLAATTILAALTGMAIPAPAQAQPPLTMASMEVRTSDIDLASPVGLDQLSNRILRRMWDICGWPQDAALAYVQTGGGQKERQACKAKLQISPNESVPVRAAFAAALARMK